MSCSIHGPMAPCRPCSPTPPWRWAPGSIAPPCATCATMRASCSPVCRRPALPLCPSRPCSSGTRPRGSQNASGSSPRCARRAWALTWPATNSRSPGRRVWPISALWSSHCMIEQEQIDDIHLLLDALPPHICYAVQEPSGNDQLLEVVMDLGREPTARFRGREIQLSPIAVSEEEISYVTGRIGAFGDDNRAGIERTLHRISAIRNRKGKVIGLTCRVGRAVFGTIAIIRDIVETGKSILLLGKPGVGKTTLLREAARVLADDLKKRVIIVDTSNEIGGDGDIPHPAIGRARRMQVPTPALQHQVMIEAVENHMPEVIVIDEIGTELEALAARTIAERGVQLIATAHGNTLENLMLNPTLADLIGGIQTVTLGDEEARRRGTQKSVLERKAPPTFDVIVEIQNWNRVAVHEDVSEVVDAILRGHARPAVLRYRDDLGEIHVERPPARRGGPPHLAVAEDGPVVPTPFSRGRIRERERAGESDRPRFA